MANVKHILPIVQSTKLLGQSVAYYPTIAKAFKSPEVAIFICQFIYWCEVFEDEECNISEWICKTSIEIYNSTGITPDAQITVRKKLKSLSVLSEKLMNAPAKLHFKFDFGMVNKILIEGIPDTRKVRNDNQVKNENGKFISASVNYGNKQNGCNLREQASVNYGNKQPLITETLYNKNLILRDILSSSENSTPSPSFSDATKESQNSKDPDDPTGDTLHAKKPKASKEKKQEKINSESKDEKEKIDKLILFFNRKTNSNYRIETTTTRKMILKLLRDGFNAKDFSDVILDRIKVWSTDEKMSEYLRPQTIFTEKNFESYLNNARKTKIEIVDNPQNDIQRLERLDPSTLTNEELTILAKNGNGLAKQQIKLRR